MNASVRYQGKALRGLKSGHAEYSPPPKAPPFSRRGNERRSLTRWTEGRLVTGDDEWGRWLDGAPFSAPAHAERRKPLEVAKAPTPRRTRRHSFSSRRSNSNGSGFERTTEAKAGCRGL